MNDNNKPMGLAIGMICNGSVPIKFMFHCKENEKFLPGGLFWTYIYAVGDFSKDPTKNYASLRTEVVEQALKQNFKYLMFLDTDVFMPTDGVNKLFSVMEEEKADIVSGIYWMKSETPQPVIYENIGDGPIWDIKPNSNFEIGGSGLGCSLINLDVFRKMKEKGIPFFKQDWVYQVNDERSIKVNVGEDHWMYKTAKELGFKVMGTSKVLCDHYDVGKDKFYPEPDTIMKIREQQSNFPITIDDEKPTIVFWNRNSVPINSQSMDKKPLAGSESALIAMAREMESLGNNVIVLCNCDKEGLQNNISYYHYDKINPIIKFLEETPKGIELFISSRDISPFAGGRPPSKQTALWFHDMPQEGSFSTESMQNIDKLLFVSDFQRKSFREYYKKQLLGDLRTEFDTKSVITSNGVEDKFFIGKEDIKTIKGRCIYASTPFRGLDILLSVWPKIKEKVPHASLHLFTGMSIYNQEEYPETQQVLDIAKKMQKYDVFLIGPVTKDRLAEEMKSSELMLYPNTYEETYCLHGDTKVGIPGGYKLLKDIKIRDKVYSYDHKNKKLTISNVKKHWLTKKNEPVYKLNYKWGVGRNAKKTGYIIGTKEHKILMKDGSYKQIQELKENDSLMPFTRHSEKKQCKNSYILMNQLNGKKRYEHDIIMEELYGVDIVKGKKIVHHLNENKSDNRIENLKYTLQSEHAKNHINNLSDEKSKKRGNKISKTHKKRLKDNPELVKHFSNAGKSRWKNITKEERSKYIKEVIQGHMTKESKQKWITSMKNIGELNKKDLNDDILYQKYIIERKSMNKISKEIGVSDRCIKRNLQRIGLDIRGHNEAVALAHNHKVVSVEFYGYEDVYDIEVEGTHNFVANDIFVHNCITVAEQLYADRKVLTSDLGALYDFKNKGQINLINGDSYSDEYMEDFIDMAIAGLKNEWKDYDITDTIPTWKDVAKQWNKIFFNTKKPKINKSKKIDKSRKPKKTKEFFNNILK